MVVVAWALMCFDGPVGSIKSHEVEGPSKHMRFLGPSKHMRFQEGKGPSKNMRFLGPPKHMRFQKGKHKNGSIKAHEVLEPLNDMRFLVK
jgi:hypothetical protein